MNLRRPKSIFFRRSRDTSGGYSTSPDPDVEPFGNVPRWDPLRYDQLPNDDADEALAMFTPAWEESTFTYWQAPPTAFKVLGVSLGAFVIVQLVQLVADVGFELLTPPARIIGVSLALAVLAYVADSVCRHRLEIDLLRAQFAAPEEAERWRSWWKMRWNPTALKAAAAGLPEGTPAQAFVAELSWYWLGLPFLAALGILGVFVDSVGVIVTVCILWAVFSRPGDLLKPPAEFLPTYAALVRSFAYSIVSFLEYGRRGEDAPFVLASTAGPRVVRELWMVLSIGLVAFVFPTSHWTLDISLAWLFGVFIAFLAPLCIIGSVTWFFFVRSVPHLETLIPERERHAAEPTPEGDQRAWVQVVEKFRASTNPRHNRQLLVGFHATAGYPVFLPIQTLREHGHILGSTGSGKTARSMLPLALQLVGIRDHPKNIEDGIPARGPVVIIDLKGEDYLFHAVREAAGERFKYFSGIATQSTHAFNPLLSLARSGLGEPIQRCAALISALNLEHGTGYGTGHFSAVTRHYLSEIVRGCPHAQSLREIELSRLSRPLTREEREHRAQNAELIDNLQRLAAPEELNVTSTSHSPELFEQRIDMNDALENDQVLYFKLSGRIDEVYARFIASIALECLYAAAYQRHEVEKRPLKPIWLFIDEFQMVAGRNFQTFMQQARSVGLSLVLANQSMADLKSRVHDLSSAVEENTAYRQIYTARTPDSHHYLATLSGETLEFAGGAEHPSVRARLRPNELRALSSREDFSLVSMQGNRDYSPFSGHLFPVRVPYCITKDQFEKYRRCSWPEPTAATLFPHANYDAFATTPSDSPNPRTSSRMSMFDEEEAPILPTPPLDTPLARRFESIQILRDAYDLAAE